MRLRKYLSGRLRELGELEPRFQLEGDDQHTDIRVALGSRLIYVDVSVVHPTAASYVAASSRWSLATARAAESRKSRQYLQRAVDENAEFVPFIVESFGGFGDRARAFVNQIAAYARVGSQLWSPHDIRTRVQRGVHDALWMRKLRMMNANLTRKVDLLVF